MVEEKYDVAIVGAGVIGLSTAYHLANKDIKTIIFEQFPIPHNRGSSHGHTRVIRYAYPDAFYCQMMVDAYKMWHNLEQEYGNTLILQNGMLEIDSKGSARIAEIESAMNSVGAEYEKLTGAEISRRFPMWKKNVKHEGLLDKSGGIILADKCIRALLQSILRRGVLIHDQVEVLGIETRFMDNVVITTSCGVYRASKVVIAAGAWTSKLLVDLHCQIPLQPLRTTVCYWKETKTGLHKFEAMPAFIDHTKDHVYGIPSYEFPGLIKISRHTGPPTSPNCPDKTDDSESIQIVREMIKSEMTNIDWTEPCIVESCMYTMTPDGHFIVDKHPRWDHVVIGAGMSGHGFKLSIVVGQILADLAMNEEPRYDISPFRIGRFSMGTGGISSSLSVDEHCQT